jgi:photosystem II PsbZ protein
MTILNTLTVLALVVLSFALIVAVPVLYASNDTSGNSNRLILLGSLAWGHTAPSAAGLNSPFPVTA